MILVFSFTTEVFLLVNAYSTEYSLALILGNGFSTPCYAVKLRRRCGDGVL